MSPSGQLLLGNVSVRLLLLLLESAGTLCKVISKGGLRHFLFLFLIAFGFVPAALRGVGWGNACWR